MNRNEILLELSLPYYDLVSYLKKKYGAVPGDFFTKETCSTKNTSIVRSDEGLYCHHIDEDKGIDLANSAKIYPFAWQKADRLVYCNLLEHLILHMKISVMRFPGKIFNPFKLLSYFGGGLPLICRSINNLYCTIDKTPIWMRLSLPPIEDNYSEYVLLLQLMMYHVLHQFNGDKGKKPEGEIISNGKKYEILRSQKTQEFRLRDSGGKIYKGASLICKYYPFWYCWNEFRRSLSYLAIDEKDRMIIANTIYEDILKRDYMDWDNLKRRTFFETYSSLLLQDFKGYGFPQFAEDYLDQDLYGSNSIDEYLSLAFPTTVPLKYSIGKEKPIFWKDKKPTTTEYIGSPFSIIRVETSFIIKKGETPFVRGKRLGLQYKIKPDFIIEYPEKGTVLATSDVEINGQYYARGEQLGSNEIDWYKVILTLTNDDYELFKQKHEIRYLKELDGCYFLG